jgi:hypothetical protein
MYRAGLDWILGFRLTARLCSLILHPEGLATLRNRFPISLRAVRHRGREPPWS